MSRWGDKWLTAAQTAALALITAARAASIDRITAARAAAIDLLTAARAASIDRITAAVATIWANQTGNTISSSYNLPNDVAENTAITLTITSRRYVDNIYLDLVNLVQNCTIRIKNEIDGVNARTVDTITWTTADDDGVIIAGFATDTDTTVTIQSAVAQGAVKAIPYRIIWRQME